jgi:hypothetical protein
LTSDPTASLDALATYRGGGDDRPPDRAEAAGGGAHPRVRVHQTDRIRWVAAPERRGLRSASAARSAPPPRRPLGDRRAAARRGSPVSSCAPARASWAFLADLCF